MKKNEKLFLFSLLGVVLFRLLPHTPNFEPIMAVSMPWAKNKGPQAGFIFCLLAIVIFDVLSGTLGVWTLVTATSYATIGLLSGLWLKNRADTAGNYIKFSIIATIAYDLVTGIFMGTMIFHQSLLATFIGQIPFTIIHLLGNITLAFALSPLLSSTIKGQNLLTQQTQVLN